MNLFLIFIIILVILWIIISSVFIKASYVDTERFSDDE
jgi:hypothetical protein